MENPNLETNDWDWEFIPNSDEHHHSTDSPSFAGRSGVILSDHFSLEGAELDNPSLVDHVNQGFTGIDHLGFSDHFAKSSEIVQNSGNSDVGTDSVTGVAVDCVKSSEIVQNSGNNDVEIINSVTGFSDHLANSSGIAQNSGNNDVEISSFAKSSEIVQNSEVEISSLTDFSDNFTESLGIVQNSENDVGIAQNENETETEKRVVWWKVPLEVLKYCALRVSPIWSVSMAAAALMGFVLLRRRYLYKMKRKSMAVQVNVTVHDKKVSQLMSQAARLNEAFSVVKRVPIIRPALPAPGMASWPVMSLR